MFYRINVQKIIFTQLCAIIAVCQSFTLISMYDDGYVHIVVYDFTSVLHHQRYSASYPFKLVNYRSRAHSETSNSCTPIVISLKNEMIHYCPNNKSIIRNITIILFTYTSRHCFMLHGDSDFACSVRCQEHK